MQRYRERVGDVPAGEMAACLDVPRVRAALNMTELAGGSLRVAIGGGVKVIVCNGSIVTLTVEKRANGGDRHAQRSGRDRRRAQHWRAQLRHRGVI